MTMLSRIGFLPLLAIGGGLVALLPSVTGDYFTGVALSLLMWIALAQSWVVISGMTGYISLGHAAFFGLGGYVMALSWLVLPIWVAIPLAGLAGGFLALCVGYPCLRVRGPYFVILTFGVAEFVKYCVVAIEAGLGKAGRLLFGTPSIDTLFYIMLGLALAATLLTHFVRRSRMGGALRAIREDETAAEAVGVPAARFKLMAYVLSGIIPGMAGAVMMMRSTYFEPLQAFSPITSFTIVSIAIIGGSDDAPGPILGALFLIILTELLWTNAPQVYMIVLGAVMVGFVLFAPDGLYGRMLKWRAGGQAS